MRTRSQRRANDDVVRDKYRRELVRTVKALEEFENHLAGPEIEVSGGFIGQQDAWVADQRPGENDPLLLASR